MIDFVVTSALALRYHTDETCAGWLQGRRNAEKRGMELHPVQQVTEAEAVRLGRKPCQRCGGR